MKTKDVVLEKSNWKQTRQSLSHVSEAGNSGSVPSTYAAAYSKPPHTTILQPHTEIILV